MKEIVFFFLKKKFKLRVNNMRKISYVAQFISLEIDNSDFVIDLPIVQHEVLNYTV
jgi:hypothetical protein